MHTSTMILLAFSNGLLIVTNRVVNAKLGDYITSAGSSFWNHLIGFLFLAIISPIILLGTVVDWSGIPYYFYLGGLIGALYVTINSVVFRVVGATKGTLFVIAGQITVGTLIDFLNQRVSDLFFTIFGISLVVIGLWLGNQSKDVVDGAN